MGNKHTKFDCSKTRKQNNSELVCSKTRKHKQKAANIYSEPFYKRDVILIANAYFEHDKLHFIHDIWENAIKNYHNSSGQMKQAINSNMHKLIDDCNFRLVKRSFNSVPIQRTVGRARYVYKLARIVHRETGELIHTAVVLVTLCINVDTCTIADSYTGKIILDHTNMVKNKEYCCNKAVVYGYKVIGELKEVMEITPLLLDGTLTVCSNFNPEFTYDISHMITESGFGKRGTGCYQGIHFFINEDAAIKYTEKGMLNTIMDIPYISKTVRPEEKTERLGQEVTSNENINHYYKPYITETAEALLRYYNKTGASSFRGLKRVCNDVYGDWYIANNFLPQPEVEESKLQ